MGSRLDDSALAALIRFGAGGNAEAVQVHGWSMPEDGFAWAVGASSGLRIPYRAGRTAGRRGALALELKIMPLHAPRTIPAQRLTVVANGVAFATETIDTACSVAFPVPGIAPDADGVLALTLLHPDGAAPADLGQSDDRRCLTVAVFEIRLYWQAAEDVFVPRFRPAVPIPRPALLADAVRGCTGLPPADMALCFESIGNNCEFGLLQRRLKAEPLGLLRFGGIWPDALLRGLRDRFVGIDAPEQLTFTTEMNDGREEYVVRCERYGMQFHSYVATEAVPPDLMRRKMATHLAFLRRKFVEQLEGGRAIFVFHHPACSSEAQARPFLHALRQWGPTALLFVTADTMPPGSVHQVTEDLFHGHIDRLMRPFHTEDVNVLAWASICANTYRLWRETGRG